jgi:isoquinoline 1-oxidoreductase beta subunit
MKRRHFVLGIVGAAGALVVGWALLPPRQRLSGSRPLAAGAGESVFNGWLSISTDDMVRIVCPKTEMGQGVHTGLAMLLADELDADWLRVQVAAAPLDPIYNNLASVVDGLPFHPDDRGALQRSAAWLAAKAMREMGVMMTGGSSSLKDLWLPMRQAGASARAMLVGAAAQAWGVPAAEVRVAAGVLSHASGRSARFGELAAAAAARPLVEDASLKSPSQFSLIGRPQPRLEARAKADGSARFGLDVVLPGMLYATVKMCPTLGGRVASFDGAAALKLPGVKQVLAVAGHQGGTAGVAVVADTPWHAIKGVEAVTVAWDEAVPAAAFSSAAALDALAQRLQSGGNAVGFGFYSQGDVEAALGTAAKVLRAEYRAPYLAHATLEPQNCTVQYTAAANGQPGQATVWAPTQVPGVARNAAAQALGLQAERVDVQVQLAGGGFGRRLDVDFIGQAAAIARAAAAVAAGVPVQTFWQRAEDTQHDFYRPAAVARFQAGFDAQGRLTAWHNVSAGQAVVPQVLARAFGVPKAMAGASPDKTTSEGAFDQPYEWPNARIAHQTVDLPVPVGFWRSVGHSHQAFFKESFVDECAHAAGADPLAFRAGLLQRHPRHLAVLQAAAKLAGWGTPLAPAADGAKQARGIALHQSFGSVVAQVAEVSLGSDGAIRVHRVCCAIDCGTPVNPGLIAQQMESGIVFGLSAALFGGIDIVAGRVQQSNFHDQPLLRIDACPRIETLILPSAEPPEGVGEPGTPPIAPAVANALFALTGERLRSLPLKLAAKPARPVAG